jgi:hypothetical protein
MSVQNKLDCLSLQAFLAQSKNEKCILKLKITLDNIINQVNYTILFGRKHIVSIILL